MLCDRNCGNLKCLATGNCIDTALCAHVEAPRIVPEIAQEMFGVPLASSATPRTIIAFSGLAGSGKSTAAAHLVEARGFARVRFAGPLKAMMAALGLTPAQIDGAEKETPCDLLGGKTPRHAMQTIGTEWGRDLIAPDLWIRAWQAAVERLPAGQPVVVDDCRFPNEAAAIRAAGGALVRIIRPGAGSGAAGHSSEGQTLSGVCATIVNDGPIGELQRAVDRLAIDWSWVPVVRSADSRIADAAHRCGRIFFDEIRA